MPSSSYKTASAAAFMLISLAAASLSWYSSVDFKGSLQQLPTAVVTAKMTLIGSSKTD